MTSDQGERLIRAEDTLARLADRLEALEERLAAVEDAIVSDQAGVSAAPRSGRGDRPAC